jgi:uncharacterized protein (DUF1800 family)
MALSLDHVQTVAFQRFGLGARKGARAALGGDPRGALLAELARPDAARLADASLPTGTAAMAMNFNEQRRIDEEERARPRAGAAAAPDMTMAAPNAMAGAKEAGGMQGPASPARPQPRMRGEDQLRRQELMARFRHGFDQPIGLTERLVAFWSNHFAISIMKGAPVQATAGAFEREAIRPHVLGRFEDMLLAAERHQAMLVFLDQRQSIGPNSRAGQNQKRGLNENLAREILELHTLGVDGGYAQSDVTSLARILTGWMIAGPWAKDRELGSSFFNANAHEPGAHALLGKTYPDGGQEQSEQALKDLARHPSTAKFIARKFARHFVSDSPPSALVARLEKSFRDASGDLRALAKTLIESKEAWDHPAEKLRTPYEFVMAAYRLVNVMPQDVGQLLGALGALGQPVWGPAGPNGHSDAFEALAAPEAMKTRLEIAWAFGRRAGGALNPFELAEDVYGSALSPETLKAIGRAESKQQGLALLLMSPEFQRR